MKRSLSAVALLTLVLFSFACATTSATPDYKGTIASINGKDVVLTPVDGGQPVNITVGWGTRVFWASGIEASGASVLTAGQPVQVWTDGGGNATKVVIAQ